MKKWKNRIYIVIVLVLIVACQSKQKNGSRVKKLPYYQEASFTPVWNLKAKELESFHKVADFKLINQEGDTITNQTFQNKIYVVDFFFTTCPGICPRMTSNLKLVQNAFVKDTEVLLLSHSVTPTKDSVTVLKEYATIHGVMPKKWHLVTGKKQEIYALGRESYFVEEGEGYQANYNGFLHTENFVLVDKNRHIRGIYNGLNTTAVQQLITDIKTLKQEI